MIVLKKVDARLKEELRTLKLIEEAWADIREGRFKEMSKKEFLRELDKWSE